MKSALNILRLVSALGTLAGCQAAKPIYHWGNYDKVVYQGYAKPGAASLDEQIENLKEDIEKAGAKNLPVHPGLHAQLGYLYYQQGKADLAREAFETEKKLFPESARFIDQLLKAKSEGAAR